MRIEHALVVPIWLFVARPFLLGRAPDAWALVAAFGFAWPGIMAYHFTTAYLEPPLLACVALSVEASVRDGAPGRRAALLTLAVGTLFKEQTILALPVLAVGAFFAADDRAEKREVVRVSALAFVPVILYVIARRHAAVWRGASLLPLGRIFDPDRLATWASGNYAAFGVAMVVLIAGALAALATARGAQRTMLAAWLAAALVQIGFFYVDGVSEPWLGYPRFSLVPAVIGASMTATLVALRADRRIASAGSVVVAFASLPTLVPLLAKARVDVDRNFYEHSDSPIFLPIRRAIALLPPGTEAVRLVSFTNALVPPYGIQGGVAAAYPELASLRWDVARPDDLEPQCACMPGEPPRVSLFVVFVNRAARHPKRSAVEAAQARCRHTMERTCASARVIESHGATWGVVGVP
jgi:hypothetical protein